MARTGRPPKYHAGLCEKLLEYFNQEPYTEHERTITRKDGSSITETYRLPAELPTLAGFACLVDVHRGTINQWAESHPEFSEALKKVKEHQERILVTNMMSGLYVTAGAIFAAKNIIGWRDQVDHKHSGNVTVTHEQALDALIGDGQQRSADTATHH